MTHMFLADGGEYRTGADGVIRVELDIEEF